MLGDVPGLPGEVTVRTIQPHLRLEFLSDQVFTSTYHVVHHCRSFCSAKRHFSTRVLQICFFASGVKMQGNVGNEVSANNQLNKNEVIPYEHNDRLVLN